MVEHDGHFRTETELRCREVYSRLLEDPYISVIFACKIVGVSHPSFNNWLKKNGKKTPRRIRVKVNIEESESDYFEKESDIMARLTDILKRFKL